MEKKLTTIKTDDYARRTYLGDSIVQRSQREEVFGSGERKLYKYDIYLDSEYIGYVESFEERSQQMWGAQGHRRIARTTSFILRWKYRDGKTIRGEAGSQRAAIDLLVRDVVVARRHAAGV